MSRPCRGRHHGNRVHSDSGVNRSLWGERGHPCGGDPHVALACQSYVMSPPHTHTHFWHMTTQTFQSVFWSISGLSARPEGCWDRAGQINGIISTHLQYQDWFLYQWPANLWFSSLKPGTKITIKNWPTKCLTAISGTSKPHLRERCRSMDQRLTNNALRKTIVQVCMLIMVHSPSVTTRKS